MSLLFGSEISWLKCWGVGPEEWECCVSVLHIEISLHINCMKVSVLR
jgi:hypothetical protein